MAKRFVPTFNAATADSPAEILVHGPIGKSFWSEEGITGEEFTNELNKIPKGTKVTVGVNSQGGAVGEGLAIYNAIQRRSEDVTVRIDGYAVSIASVFPLGASKVVSPKSSIWMIHNAWGYSEGNAEDMRKYADTLETHDQTMRGIYAGRTGKSDKAVADAMAAETWFTGSEAVAWGLADEETDGAVALASIDMSALPAKSVGRHTEILNSLKPAVAPQGAVPTPNHQEQMHKQKIIALLKKHGIDASETETEEQLQAKLDKIPTATAPPIQPIPNPAISAEDSRIKKMEERWDRERATRISRDLDQLVLDGRISAAESKDWLPKCIAEAEDTPTENTILATLKKREPVLMGADPVRNIATASDMKTARDTIKSKKEGKERRDFIVANWESLKAAGVPLVPDNPIKAAMRGTPVAANTMDSTALTTDVLASSFITVLQNRLAPLSAFSTNFGTDRIKPLSEIQVPIVTTGGTAQTNATNFEDTTNFVGTVDNRPVQPARITSGAHLTAAELNQGFFMQQFAEIKAHELADAVQAAVNAILTQANFTSTVPDVSFGNFGHDELGALWEVIAKSGVKNVMLHQSYYRNFLPSNRFAWDTTTQPGWDGFFLNTYWTGAGTNVRGFACNPQAVAVGAGLPLASPNRGMLVSARTITLPEIGLSIEQQEWFATAGKVDWTNWEVMFGAALGDASAGVVQRIP